MRSVSFFPYYVTLLLLCIKNFGEGTPNSISALQLSPSNIITFTFGAEKLTQLHWNYSIKKNVTP